MAYFSYALLFLFGLMIGSFLNVLIWRYKPDQNVFAVSRIGGRSNCPHCFKILHWNELVPIFSFLIQGGKCRSCRAKLSLQYPLVEFLSGIIFIGVPIFLSHFYGIKNFVFVSFQASPWFYGLVFVWLAIFLIWFLVVAIDIKEYLVPNELNLILAVLGAILTLVLFTHGESFLISQTSFLKHFSFLFTPFQNIVLNHILGALAGSVLFSLIVFLSRGRGMGFGDVKLAFAAGLILGWPDIGLAAALAFIFGGLWGAILIFLRRKTMKDKIPFAPFFVLGALLTVFFGFQIVSFYFRLFRLE